MPTVLAAFPTDVYVLRAEQHGGEVRTYFSASAAAAGVLYFWSDKGPLRPDQVVRACLEISTPGVGPVDLTDAVRAALAGLPWPVWPGDGKNPLPQPELRQYDLAVAAWKRAAKTALVAALSP